MLDVKDSQVTELITKLLRSTPRSWQECVQLEIEERAKAEPGNTKRKKLHLTSQSADTSAAANAGQTQSVPLEDSPVQLVWGYILRQLKRIGEEHAQWQLLDTSQSGVTGHSGKVDFCFSAVQQKAWPQVVAVTHLKQDLQTESQHAECIGRLSACSKNIFIIQPQRKHVMLIAGSLDGLEIVVFFKNQSILRSGLPPLSLNPSCRGLRWLCKLLFSSLPALGFMPELPPLINTTPKGVPDHDLVFLRPDAPTTDGPGHACKVFQAQYGVHRELVALKVGVSAAYEADMLTELADTAGVIQVVEKGTLPDGLPYLITRPFGSLPDIDDSAELIIHVVQGAASIIQQLACRTPPVLHRDISVGNLIYHGDDQSPFLIDFGTAVVAPTGRFEAVNPQSITGTPTFIAQSVLQGEGYTMSSELKSLMYVFVFLVVEGAAHWVNKPIGATALAAKVATFNDQKLFEKYVLQRCRSDFMQAVKRLRNLFWQPRHQHSVIPLQFCQSLQPA